MKSITTFFSVLLFSACTHGKDETYIGSTPANAVVRDFIGIPLSDSVDFIRWKLMLFDNRYELQCNYGISQPNTNGFIKGGTKAAISGSFQKEKNIYHFSNGVKSLKSVELNTDLLQILNHDNSLLVGNGGWSYTLNNVTASRSNELSISAAPTDLKDSMIFEGRTPCGVPGVIAPGDACYKLKWLIVFYADTERNEPSRYKIRSTAWRKAEGRTGTWKIISTENGQTIYQLNDERGNAFLYLLKLDEAVLIFTDAAGKLLVGNEDFSYTLNRKR